MRRIRGCGVITPVGTAMAAQRGDLYTSAPGRYSTGTTARPKQSLDFGGADEKSGGGFEDLGRTIALFAAGACGVITGGEVRLRWRDRDLPEGCLTAIGHWSD